MQLIRDSRAHCSRSSKASSTLVLQRVTALPQRHRIQNVHASEPPNVEWCPPCRNNPIRIPFVAASTLNACSFHRTRTVRDRLPCFALCAIKRNRWFHRHASVVAIDTMITSWVCCSLVTKHYTSFNRPRPIGVSDSNFSRCSNAAGSKG